MGAVTVSSRIDLERSLDLVEESEPQDWGPVALPHGCSLPSAGGWVLVDGKDVRQRKKRKEARMWAHSTVDSYKQVGNSRHWKALAPLTACPGPALALPWQTRWAGPW